MTILDPNFLDKIERAKSQIDGRKLDTFVDKMFDVMTKEAIVNASLQDADNAKRKKTVIRNFQKAWDYTIEQYKGEFSLDLMMDITGRVEPYLANGKSKRASLRRSGGTVMPGAGYVPPCDGARVDMHLDRMMETLANTDMHPLEEAIFLYFHIARIQPFQNANKRTANIAMNTTLRYNGFTPISINASDDSQARLFEKYLIEGFNGFRQAGANVANPIDAYLNINYGQSQFYQFLANKELRNLRTIKDYLKGLDTYTVEVVTNNPGVLYTVKRRVGSCFKNGTPHQEKLDTRKKTIEVTGEIDFDQLKHAMKGLRGVRRYKISYEGKH